MFNLHRLATNIYEIFWHHDFWLPPNTTWHDLELSRSMRYDETLGVSYLWWSLVAGLLLWMLHHFALYPLFASLGEQLFDNLATPKTFVNGKEQFLSYVKKFDLSEEELLRDVEKCQKRKNGFAKWSSEFCFDLYFAVNGMWLWRSKEWMRDLNELWQDYPFHPPDSDVWWSYFTKLAYVWSTTLPLCSGLMRNPAKVDDGYATLSLFLHHVATIGLLSISWICNSVRIGTFVAVLNTLGVVALDVAVLAKIIGFKNAHHKLLYPVFLVIWIATRLFGSGWIFQQIWTNGFNWMGPVQVHVSLFFLAFLLLLNLVWSSAFVMFHVNYCISGIDAYFE